MDTTDAIVAAESAYRALLNDPRRTLSRFVGASLTYGRMLADLDPERAVDVLVGALETLKDPPAPAEAEVALELVRTLRPVAARLGLAELELTAIDRERSLLDHQLVAAAPGVREALCRRAAAVRFAERDIAAGFTELIDGLRACDTDGLDDLATDFVLAVRRHRVPADARADLEQSWVELRRHRFAGNWPLWCLTALGMLRLDADDTVTAQMYVRRSEGILGHLRRPVAGALVGGWVALATGDIARAHERFTYAAGAGGHEGIRLLAATGLGESLMALGRPDEARAPLTEAIGYDIGDPTSVGRAHELLAEIAAADGRHADAYQHLQQARRLEQIGRGEQPTPSVLAADVSDADAVVDVRDGSGVEATGAVPAPVPPPVPSELLGEARSSAATLLADALRHDWLHLYFHEIYDNGAQRSRAAEALLRMGHPTAGWLEPAAFLDGLDDPNVADDLTSWTVTRACDTILRMAAAGDELAVVVNVSAIQLSPALPLLVAAALERSGAPAALLTVELDGDAAATIDDDGIGWLNELRALGVRLGVDRYGGALRSVETLLELPVDVVKLDRSVFGGIDAGGDLASDDRLLVESIVSLSKTFGFQVIATGIETPVQFQRQRDMGCHGAQGFGIGVPVAESQLHDRLVRVA